MLDKKHDDFRSQNHPILIWRVKKKVSGNSYSNPYAKEL